MSLFSHYVFSFLSHFSFLSSLLSPVVRRLLSIGGRGLPMVMVVGCNSWLCSWVMQVDMAGGWWRQWWVDVEGVSLSLSLSLLLFVVAVDLAGGGDGGWMWWLAVLG